MLPLPLGSRPYARDSGVSGAWSRVRRWDGWRWTPAAAAAASLLLLLAGALVWRPGSLFAASSRDCIPVARLPSLLTSVGSTTSGSAPSPSAALSLALAPSLHASYAHLTELIVVAGHAVLVGQTLQHDLHDPKHWTLLSYQSRQLASFLSHIRRGVELAQQRPHALLLFTGGQTRRAAGPRSEGQSYWLAAEHEDWWISDATVRSDVSARALTEEYSRDSFENVAFSLARFHVLTGGRWPEHITVVGFPWKARRFSGLHRAALRWPAERWSYEGAEDEQWPTEWSEQQREEERALVRKGERENSYIPFLNDPMGCTSGPLGLKKAKRDPFRRPPPYEWTVPPMAGLLRHCEGAQLYAGPLPWDPQGEELAKSERLFEEERRRIAQEQQ